MLKKRSLLALSLILLLALQPTFCPTLAQQASPDFSSLEKVVLEELKETNTPGAAVAVVSSDRILFARGFGTSNIETGTPVRPEMLFRIASTTKMYTAAVLTTLAEEGKLKLDEPIGNYIKGLSPKLSQVTAHQLMSHTAGLKHESPSYGKHDESAMATTVRSWKDDYSYIEPGRVLSYSNPGFALAGVLIEEVGGKPYADQISERLLKPLGMASTTFRPTMAMTYPLSQGHQAVGTARPTVVRPFSDNAAHWPAAFIFSSVNDLSRFAIMFMNGGKIDGKQVLSPSVVARMQTPYADIPRGSNEGKYGYGLMIHDFRGVKMVEHGGSIDGFVCLFQMVPEQRVAVIILANKSGASLRKIAERAFELMLPLSVKVETPKQDLPITEAEMADYSGIYLFSDGRKIELLVKEGKLFLRQGAVEMPVTKSGEARLSFTPPNTSNSQEFAVVRGASGKVEFLHTGSVAFKKVQNGH